MLLPSILYSNNGLAPGAMVAFYLLHALQQAYNQSRGEALWFTLITLTYIFLAIQPYTPLDFPSPSSGALEKGIRYSIPIFSGILVLFFFYLASIIRH